MDFSKFKTSDWLIVGGGVGMLIFGFLPWVKAGFSGLGISVSENGNAFDFFWTGTLPWILLIAAAVVTVLLIQGTLKQEMAPWGLILLVVTALALLLLLIRLIFNPLEGKDLVEDAGGSVTRQFGLYLAVLAGIASTVGAFLNFQAAGGDLKDLTDVNKLKSSFSKGDDNPPPPPPPAAGGDVPPPPPPA